MGPEAREQASPRKLSLSFTVEPTTVKIMSEPYVILTARGYAPVVDAEVVGEPDSRIMYISAGSLSNQLEELRIQNEGKFKGITAKIRKESTDKFAKYILEEA